MWIKTEYNDLINLDAVAEITINQGKSTRDENVFEVVVSYRNPVVSMYGNLDGSGEKIASECIASFVNNLGAAQAIVDAIFKALAEGKTVLDFEEINAENKTDE